MNFINDITSLLKGNLYCSLHKQLSHKKIILEREGNIASKIQERKCMNKIHKGERLEPQGWVLTQGESTL